MYNGNVQVFARRKVGGIKVLYLEHFLERILLCIHNIMFKNKQLPYYHGNQCCLKNIQDSGLVGGLASG